MIFQRKFPVGKTSFSEKAVFREHNGSELFPPLTTFSSFCFPPPTSRCPTACPNFTLMGCTHHPLPSPCEQDTSLLLGQPRRCLVCLQGILAQSHPCSVPFRTGHGGGSREHRCRLHVEVLGNGRLHVAGRRKLGSTCIHGVPKTRSDPGAGSLLPRLARPGQQ